MVYFEIWTLRKLTYNALHFFYEQNFSSFLALVLIIVHKYKVPNTDHTLILAFPPL